MINFYNEQNTEDSKERFRNIQELLTTINQFCEKNVDSTISEFLEEVSLLTSIDSWNDSTNHITLMTVHSAKGLEFPIVFITGLEDGLFPISNSFDDPKKMEEERRLFYVDKILKSFNEICSERRGELRTKIISAKEDRLLKEKASRLGRL